MDCRSVCTKRFIPGELSLAAIALSASALDEPSLMLERTCENSSRSGPSGASSTTVNKAELNSSPAPIARLT